MKAEPVELYSSSRGEESGEGLLKDLAREEGGGFIEEENDNFGIAIKKLVISVLIGVLLLFLEGGAGLAAGKKELREARKLYLEGQKLASKNLYKKALFKFLAALKLVEGAEEFASEEERERIAKIKNRFLYLIAWNYEKIGDYKNSYRYYQRFLSHGVSPKLRKKADAALKRLFPKIYAVLILKTIPKGAEFIVTDNVNRLYKGETPANLKVLPGIYQLMIKKEGFYPYRTSLSLEIRDYLEQTVKLVPKKIEGEKEREEKGQMATLYLNSQPTGAEFLVERFYHGKRYKYKRGKTPVKLKLKSGRYYLTLKKDHHQVYRTVIFLTPGSTIYQKYNLIRAGGERKIPPPDKKRTALTAAAITSGSLGIIAAATGIAFMVKGVNGNEVLKNQLGRRETNNQYLIERYKEVKNSYTAGIVSLSIAGFALATALGIFIYSSIKPAGKKSPVAPKSSTDKASIPIHSNKHIIKMMNGEL